MTQKTVYPIGDFRYGTRMMRAGGDPIPMSGPDARLFLALGKVSLTKPRSLKGSGGLHEALTGETPTAPTGLAAALPVTNAAPKKAPRKRKAKAKK